MIINAMHRVTPYSKTSRFDSPNESTECSPLPLSKHVLSCIMDPSLSFACVTHSSSPIPDQSVILGSYSISAKYREQIRWGLHLHSTIKPLSNSYHFCPCSTLDTCQILPSTSLIAFREQRVPVPSPYWRFSLSSPRHFLSLNSRVSKVSFSLKSPARCCPQFPFALQLCTTLGSLPSPVYFLPRIRYEQAVNRYVGGMGGAYL
jgi:hypothetical protein